MKKLIFTLLIIPALFISCASDDVEDYDSEYDYTNDEIILSQPEMNEDFIGDFDVFRIDDLMFLQKSKKTVKAKEVNGVYLVPRTNSVELHFRDGINSVVIILNKDNRNKILEACQTFLTQYDEKTLPHHKVNSKTAYFKSRCSFWFGVITPTNGCHKNDFYANVEFIDKRPYLLLHFLPSRCDDEVSSNIFTPKTSLYMSPSQIKDFMSLMDQENLNKKVEGLKQKAYTY